MNMDLPTVVGSIELCKAFQWHTSW